MRENRPEDALEKLDNLINSEDTPENLKVESLMLAANLNQYFLNDLDQTYILLENVIDNYANSPHASLASSKMEIIEEVIDSKPKIERKDKHRIPQSIDFLSAFPNPFNSTTNIQYRLESTGLVTLTIHDIKGREIARLIDEEQSAGYQTFAWNAANVPSGIYFCKLYSTKINASIKLTIIK